jgi:hypothetical protein
VANLNKIVYRASADLTVTNLAGIASSATWVAGWTSGTVDNTTDLDLDKQVSAKFTVESAGLAAGEIRVYVYDMLDDSNWPDLFSSGTEGTEGTATVHDVNVLASMKLLWSIATDTTASQVYPMLKQSVSALYGGVMPPKFALFVAQSTGTTFETSGQQVTVKGAHGNNNG